MILINNHNSGVDFWTARFLPYTHYCLMKPPVSLLGPRSLYSVTAAQFYLFSLVPILVIITYLLTVVNLM